MPLAIVAKYVTITHIHRKKIHGTSIKIEYTRTIKKRHILISNMRVFYIRMFQ